MQPLLTALFLALVTERVTTALQEPAKKRWPDWSGWWLVLYLAWLIGGALAYLANLNLFEGLITFDPLVGRLLTAVVVGGGGNLIHDIFDRPQVTKVSASTPGAGTVTATVLPESKE